MRELPDPYVLAFLLLAAVALMLSYNRLLVAVRGGVSCLHGLNGTQEMLGNKYICSSVRLAFFLLVPFYALTLVLAGISTAGYAWTLAALAALLLFRKLACLLMGWLGSRPGAFRAVERTGYALGVLVILFSWWAGSHPNHPAGCSGGLFYCLLPPGFITISGGGFRYFCKQNYLLFSGFCIFALWKFYRFVW